VATLAFAAAAAAGEPAPAESAPALSGPALSGPAAPSPALPGPAAPPSALPAAAAPSPVASAPTAAPPERAPGGLRAPSAVTGGARAPSPSLRIAPPPASPIAAESAHLRIAMRRLRVEGDADGALAALGAYRARFPAGLLADEALVLEIDALVARARWSEALARLEGRGEALVERSDAARLLRAELRARAGRCAEALVDFTAALRRPGGHALHERALFGRAGCRIRTGDAAGARADLEHFVARFPGSARFGAARAALGR
jgi:hypothetical protein